MVCFLGEAQILRLTAAWHQAGAGEMGEHKNGLSCCFSVSPHHFSIARIALLQNKDSGHCTARGTVRLPGHSWLVWGWHSQAVDTG